MRVEDAPATRPNLNGFSEVYRVMDERDRLYTERAQSAARALDVALNAQKELTAAAFTASEKAIAKAELAQKESSSRTDELREALGKQATDLASLRESRSEGGGRQEASREAHQDKSFTTMLYVSLIFGVLSFLMSAVGLLLRFAKP